MAPVTLVEPLSSKVPVLPVPTPPTKIEVAVSEPPPCTSTTVVAPLMLREERLAVARAPDALAYLLQIDLKFAVSQIRETEKVDGFEVLSKDGIHLLHAFHSASHKSGIHRHETAARWRVEIDLLKIPSEPLGKGDKERGATN